MRILLADKLSESCVGLLEQDGHEVFVRPELKGDHLTEALGELDPNVLVVRSTKVPAAAMSGARSLELIVRAGAGTDNIDVAAASGRGIFVANCPGKNAAAVAELAIGLMLSLDRSIPENVQDAREGRWNKARYGKAVGLKGRTLGVIGLGNIGTEVVSRALALEMDVVAWSRSLTDEAAEDLGITRLGSPGEIAATSDVVSIHVAGSEETEHLANEAFFAAMKPGAFFINTARSSVVDEAAMERAIDEKGIRVALDVFSNEPAVKEGTLEHPLASRPGVYITHHIGASTAQAQEEIAEEAVRVITTYADSNVVENCINISRMTHAGHQITVRHLDRVGVLAFVLNEMSKAGWNVQEMQNLIFADGDAACAVIRFDGAPDPAVVERIQANSDILAVTLIDL